MAPRISIQSAYESYKYVGLSYRPPRPTGDILVLISVRSRVDPRAIKPGTFRLVAQLDCFRNVIAHVKKPDFVFRRSGRVHLNRQGRQFSRLLAAEMSASAVVMLDTAASVV